MPAKAKVKRRPATRSPAPPEDLLARPCVTTEDRLEQIRLLGRKVEEHVKYVARMGALAGTSAEARDRAVMVFHARLVLLEGALARTLDDLRLA
jgi:hypothetical protein